MSDAQDPVEAPEDAPEEASAAEPIEPGYRGRAAAQAALVTIVCGAALGYAFSPAAIGAAKVLPIVGATYAVLGAGAIAFLRRRGELREQLAPRQLDITAGGLVAGVLYLVASAVPLVLLRGRPANDWVWRAYGQLGTPYQLAAPYVGPALLVIAAAEEVVWRGWVMRALAVAYGGRRALWLSTALYALVHASTLWTLRTDVGPNPLIVAAAALGGLVWGGMALRFGRLAPSVFAHAIFSWSAVLFPLWAR